MANEGKTILFADIANSTGLYQSLGNKRAEEQVNRILTLMSEIIADHRGRVVKTIGDEIMALFEQIPHAIQAGLNLIQMIRAMPVDHEVTDRLTTIRVGLEYGEVIERGGDYYGNAVNIASRLVKQAKSNQILTTKESLEQIAHEEGFSSRLIDRTRLKGLHKVFEIYEVLSIEDAVDMTTTFSIKFPELDKPITERLRVLHGDDSYLVNNTSEELTMGRSSDNTLVVSGDMVSRYHATIQYHKGKFVFRDESVNGSFVKIEPDQERFIHRDEIILLGEGSLSLGQPIGDTGDNVIFFRIETA